MTRVGRSGIHDVSQDQGAKVSHANNDDLGIPRMRVRIARRFSTTSDVLSRLARDPEVEVRREVAQNPSTSAADLHLLAHDTDQSVRWGVAANPGTAPETWSALVNDPYMEVRRSIASHTPCPVGMLTTLSTDVEPLVRARVASNPSTPPDVLAALSEDPADEVSTRAREQLASHSRFGAATHSPLATDTLRARALVEKGQIEGWLQFEAWAQQAGDTYRAVAMGRAAAARGADTVPDTARALSDDPGVLAAVDQLRRVLLAHPHTGALDRGASYISAVQQWVNGAVAQDYESCAQIVEAVDTVAADEDPWTALVLRSTACAVRWPEYLGGDGYWPAASALHADVAGAGLALQPADMDLLAEISTLGLAGQPFLDLGIAANPDLARREVLAAVERSPLDPIICVAAMHPALQEPEVEALLSRVDDGSLLIATIFGQDAWSWPAWQYAFSVNTGWPTSPAFWSALLLLLEIPDDAAPAWAGDFLDQLEASELEDDLVQVLRELATTSPSIAEAMRTSTWDVARRAEQRVG